MNDGISSLYGKFEDTTLDDYSAALAFADQHTGWTVEQSQVQGTTTRLLVRINDPMHMSTWFVARVRDRIIVLEESGIGTLGSFGTAQEALQALFWTEIELAHEEV